MAALSGDYKGCSVLVYDVSGNHLGSTIISYHDKDTLRVGVENIPLPLNIGDNCKLLILTAPTPCEYQGRIIKEGRSRFVAMYLGREYENRENERHCVNSIASIESFISDGRAYPLHTALDIQLINISKSGVRFSAPNNSLFNNDLFQMRLKISNNDKLLIAEVVNQQNRNANTSEYGCRFLVGSVKENKL